MHHFFWVTLYLKLKPVATNGDLPADVEQGPVEDFRLDDVGGEEDVGHVVVLASGSIIYFNENCSLNMHFEH